ncbi:MAG TPA: BlaI/MecI/CopY family transcriptional regulator [Pirellulales bacterium]|jgi:predicted transcriptional regulator|nr:BlaI/MecI/CopY family transcriptional regulator [Pirellulales bacterium]
MPKKPDVPRLSAGEIELLQMLWREGAVTLSEAHQALGLPIGYTTVQTRLNRLVKKGVAARGDERPARYRAGVAQRDVSARDLNLLVKRVSVGNVVPLVAHLVRDRSLTAAQIVELKGLLEEAEKRLRAQKREKLP